MSRHPVPFYRGAAIALLITMTSALVAALVVQAMEDPPQLGSRSLADCQAKAAAALDDPACRQAWKAARERFLGSPSR